MAKTIAEKIKEHYEHQRYARIIRQIAEDHIESADGYIVAYSDEFIILQEIFDFIIRGYLILPIAQIKQIRLNENYRFVGKLMKLEKEIDNIGINYKIDLSNWPSLFRTLKKCNLPVIVECEHFEIDTFSLGPIAKVTNKLVYINCITPKGIMQKETTSVDFASITKIGFGDKYSTIFFKHARPEK